MSFPVLYKKTSTGAIQFWEISVDLVEGLTPLSIAGKITVKYGQQDTDSPQLTIDTVFKGKNTGKKNATNPFQQAELEAKAKWEKQKKKGYVETMDDAQNDKIDDLIEGGILPMLAHKYTEHAHKIKYPAYVQPKLDGIRCIAIVKEGACTLWSRTRKPITSCPHIVAEIEALFESENIVLDGELYNHEYKTNFEKIVSLVRQEKPDNEHYLVQYHIYDVASVSPFDARNETLAEWLAFLDEQSSLRLVPTALVGSESEVMPFFDLYKSQGYEGAMLRNRNGIYVNKRSYDLQKVKEFDDAEFKIVGIDEGRGKLVGHVGSFVCVTADGKHFNAKAKGETGKLREYFENHELWTGRLLTVQYQGLTVYGIPRFPVGVAIRDYE